VTAGPDGPPGGSLGRVVALGAYILDVLGRPQEPDFALFSGRGVYGVGANDPGSFFIVVLVLLGVAALASVLPAIRATRVSPLEAIRVD